MSRFHTRDDDGASLMLVLILVTVFAVGLGVTLSFADTNVRVTVGLRTQASNTSSGDSAGQLFVNKINQDSTKTLCATTAASQLYSNIDPGAADGAPTSAFVSCSPDPNNSGGNPGQPNASPGSALLALDNNVAEDGLYVNVNAGKVKIRGGVFSNSDITAAKAPDGLTNTWTPPPSNPTGKTYNIARGACTGSITVQTPSAGSTTCNYATPDARGSDPGTFTPHGDSYDAPAGPETLATVTCVGTGPSAYQMVTQGLFPSLASLNAVNGACGNHSNVLFSPGIYYFKFSGVWNVPSINIIGGTLSTGTSLAGNLTPSQVISGCVAPGTPGATTGSGVEFVFGGASQIAVNSAAGNGTQMAICASNTVTGPPIAIYGLKGTITGSAGSLLKTTLCSPGPASTCALVSTGNSPKSTLTIQGTTYTPRSFISIVMNNNSQKIFYWGLIAWAISITGTGSPDVSNAVVDVPDGAADATPAPAYMYLTVYVCPGSTCSAVTGRVSLRAKLYVPSDGARLVTVQGWSEVR